MGALRRLVSFGLGGGFGFVVGAGVALLTAPRSGAALRQQVGARAAAVKAAGDAAQAAVEEALIGRFRAEVGDPQALKAEEAQAKLLRSEALAALGLGLNAQGALAALELRHRAGLDAAGSRVSEERSPGA